MKWARSGPGMPCVHDSFLFAFIYSPTFFFFFFCGRGKLGMGVSDAMRQHRCSFQDKKPQVAKRTG